jgi:hypothetical protein
MEARRDNASCSGRSKRTKKSNEIVARGGTLRMTEQINRKMEARKRTNAEGSANEAKEKLCSCGISHEYFVPLRRLGFSRGGNPSGVQRTRRELLWPA